MAERGRAPSGPGVAKEWNVGKGIRPEVGHESAALAVVAEATRRFGRGITCPPGLHSSGDDDGGRVKGDASRTDNCQAPGRSRDRDDGHDRCFGAVGGDAGERAGEVVMMFLPRAVRVYFAVAPANLRKSFEGLSNEVRGVLRSDPLSGHVFVFVNKRRTQVKLLVWTRGGFTIVHKRLERGTFAFPAKITPEATSVSLDVHELSMLLEGIDFERAQVSRRWEPPSHMRAA